MWKPMAKIWVFLMGVSLLLLGVRIAYGQRRPLPPPVIVVKPVPKVEIYRVTPYWMVVPSYDFRYIVRYPPRPRAYRGVYVAWPWPVYVPYGGPQPPMSFRMTPSTEGAVGGFSVPELAPPEHFGEGAAAAPSPRAATPGPNLVPSESPPEPPTEEPLPELIPPPIPQPALPAPEPNR
ncbi:MAG: hypothetical protein NZ602_11850 [Thermoguttaceae bacterium]|nr:hypothetical protein [Thermoguttaceae bacterium]MDW8039281.1 hypothetical protein [Thermoguttaceae bacterium]